MDIEEGDFATSFQENKAKEEMRPDNLTFKNPAYEKFIRSKPCLVCGRKAQAHHVFNSGGKKARNSFLAVPLCEPHHLHGYAYSYHALGKAGFEDCHSLNLEWEIINLLSEFISLTNP